MKTGTKLTWGLILNFAGAILFFVGLCLSFTLIGACVGLPMMAVGFPLIIWGAVWFYKARAEKAGETIAKSIQEGLSRFERPPAALPPASSGSTSNAPPPAPISLPTQSQTSTEKVDPAPGSIPVGPKSAEWIAEPRPRGSIEPRDWLKRGRAAAAVFGEGVKDGILIAVRSLSQRQPAALAVALVLMTCVAATLGVLLYQQSSKRSPNVITSRDDGGRNANEPSTRTPNRSPSPTLATTHRSTPPSVKPPAIESNLPITPERRELAASTKIAGAASVNPAIPSPPSSTAKEPPKFAEPEGDNAEAARQAPANTTQWAGEQFPETRGRFLSHGEVQQWSFERLQYAINEMFARRGADFGDKRVAGWFQQFSWYRPMPALTFDEIEAAMPSIERDNLKLLGAMRDAKRSMAPLPSNSMRPGTRPRVNPNFPPTPLGQRLGKFFQGEGDNARNSKGPRKSPSPTNKRKQ